MANHLLHESSPYLQQHAHNPVDWYPWGPEALDKARREDKPIFLSIGYSACHWCHVMAHESFEDERIAAILNKHFISIKVDREERPDLDRIYMAAVQAMTGSGGWPLSVFLTPDGRPFYGGTYFPPEPRYGMPAFAGLLRAVADAWGTRRSELAGLGEKLVASMEAETLQVQTQASSGLTRETLDVAYRSLVAGFDPAKGGWNGAPKFPQAMALEFLLRYFHLTGQASARDMVTHTLEKMARGGIYDQIGGGFHRYSVDAHWTVPHFEKMLYDNAQLARVYLHAWQLTGSGFFRAITEEILEWVIREMIDPAGGFYSSRDADSEGEEGKFYLWTPDQIREVLGPEAEAFIAAYGVTKEGNFSGSNILEFAGEPEQRSAFAEARYKLYLAREQRAHPGRDEKVLASWNGLMLAAFADAARALGREDYRQVAEENASFLLDELQPLDGRLLHAWRAGVAKVNGYLEDYACMMAGLIELYQTTFDPRCFWAAREFAETMCTHFQAPGGGFFDTSDDDEELIFRPRELQDNATPSGSAMATTALLELAGLAVEPRYLDLARQSLVQVQPLLSAYPLGFGQWLQALSYDLSKPQEIAILGDPALPGTQALLEVVRGGYRPFQVVALGAPSTRPSAVPLLQDRGLLGTQAAAYVCRGFACKAPVAEPEALRGQLE